MRILSIAIILCGLAAGPAAGQRTDTARVDAMALIRSDPDLAAALGVSKLTPAEINAWNQLLNHILAGKELSVALDAAREGGATVASRTATAFVTKLDSEDHSVLRLRNGAVVEVTRGYVRYVGSLDDVVLIDQGSRCRLWIEGKQAFPCQVLKSPVARPSYAELVVIREVQGDGARLVMIDGSIFEISSFNRFDASRWVGGSEALLIDGSRLVNLEESGGVIEVVRIR